MAKLDGVKFQYLDSNGNELRLSEIEGVTADDLIVVTAGLWAKMWVGGCVGEDVDGYLRKNGKDGLEILIRELERIVSREVRQEALAIVQKSLAEASGRFEFPPEEKVA